MRKFWKILLICALWVAGCGGDSVVVNQSVTPAPEPVPTGRVLVNFDLQPRIIPNVVNQFRFIGFDANGQVVYGPKVFDKASDITLEGVPVTIARLRIELLSNGLIFGLYETGLSVTENDTTVVDDVDWLNVNQAANLALNPSQLVLSVGQTANFTALSQPQSADPQNVTAETTFTSTNPAVLRVDGPGVVTALTVGTATLTATSGEDIATAEVTVTAASVTRVDLAPNNGRVLGEYQFRLIGTFSDGRTTDLSELATWSTTDPGVLAVSNAPASRGLATTRSLGTTQVTADFQGLTATQSVQTLPGASLLSFNGTNDGGGNQDSVINESATLDRVSSTDGRFVVFTSSADDLLPPGSPVVDTNNDPDIYVRDNSNNVNILVSVNAGGTDSGNSASSQPAISQDGRFVVFASNATDLVLAPAAIGTQIYRRDLQTGITELVSLNGDGVPVPADSSASGPICSADGSIVGFATAASNMPVTGSGAKERLIVRNLTTGSVVSAAIDPSGAEIDDFFSLSTMSDDGQRVSFSVEAAAERIATYMRDLSTGVTVEASTNSDGTPLLLSQLGLLTDDPNEVIFFGSTTQSGLGNHTGTFVKHLDTGELEFLNDGIALSSSSDGRFLAITGLNIFGLGSAQVLDRQTGAVSPVIVSEAGLSVTGLDFFFLSFQFLAISPDGSRIYFTTNSDEVDTAVGTNPSFQVYQVANPLLP